jgi:hypothetical protein
VKEERKEKEKRRDKREGEKRGGDESASFLMENRREEKRKEKKWSLRADRSSAHVCGITALHCIDFLLCIGRTVNLKSTA